MIVLTWGEGSIRVGHDGEWLWHRMTDGTTALLPPVLTTTTTATIARLLAQNEC